MRTLNLYFFLFSFILTLCSCATLLNSKKTSLRITTSRPSMLVLDKDTLHDLTTSKLISVVRDRRPLNLIAFDDSTSRSITIDWKNSYAYWLNFFPPYLLGAGFLIDTKTKRRYTYPESIYIDFGVKDSSFIPFIAPDTLMSKFFNVLKITPLKVGGMINPSIELSYERKIGSDFSTQLMASYLLPKSVMDVGDNFKPAIKGYRIAIEEKFYLKKSAIFGTYVAMELDYLDNAYNDIWHFGINNVYSDTSYSYADTIKIKKQAFSFNMKIGTQTIRKRITCDVYGGIGFKYKNVTHFDRRSPHDEREGPTHRNIEQFTGMEGKYWTISIPLNLRVGWAF